MGAIGVWIKNNILSKLRNSVFVDYSVMPKIQPNESKNNVTLYPCRYILYVLY
jgi:hypothetical protein